MSQRPPRHVPLDQVNDWDRETQRAFAASCTAGGPGEGRAVDRQVAQERAANPQEKELPIKAPPPLPPNREEAQRQASAGAASQVSQSGLLSEGTQGYLQEGWLSSALGAYIDRQHASPGVREHFMEIERLFTAFYPRQWMFNEYQPVSGSIFAITRDRRVVSIDIRSLDVSAPMRMKPRLEASMEPVLGADSSASVPDRVPARTLPAELSPPPAASDARVPTKAPPGCHRV